MRRTVQIAGGIESLFGTLDENLKLFESALRVTTHLQDDKLAIEGEPAQVERAVRILDEYNELVHEGRVLDNGAVKALLRVVTEEPNISLRGILQPGRPRAFGKKSITPKSANQRRYMEFIERYDMVFAMEAKPQAAIPCFRRAVEIDPKYVQAAVTRWEAFTGAKAIRQRETRTKARRGR